MRPGVSCARSWPKRGSGVPCSAAARFEGVPIVGRCKEVRIVFAADLARQVDLDVAVDFLGVRSYGDGQQSSGVVEITTDLSHSIEGRHVILVEDIVDTGLTVSYLLQNLVTRQPASLKVASLLHKPARTRVPVDIDYLGFTVADVFVVGYGLDHAQKFRNLPYLGVVTDDSE